MRLPRIDPSRPPPGPTRAEFWRSPLRSPRLTAMLGLVLLIGLPIVAITGLLSNDAYQPGFADNALGRHLGPLDFYLFGWPHSPSFLYAVTQGAHVTIGLALFPVVLTKLWSVIPRLFEWPPVHSPAHALERLSLALLVGGALFEFITGILNIQYWYLFNFDFTQAHYYGAWVFIGAMIAHVTLKFGTMRHSLTTREEVLAVTAGQGLISPNPSPVSISRRALLTAVGGASLILLTQGIGQSVGGKFRSLAFLLPRGATRPGPLGFPVNKTWARSGLKRSDVDASWRLSVHGRDSATFTLAQLMALPQYTHKLPIACVEGWSTTQSWTGIRVIDLAKMVGVHGDATLTSTSLEHGNYGEATLGHEQVSDPRTLLALGVNGRPLPLDHGYPARIISPAVPGVHCTKWVTEMRFEELNA